MKSKFNKNQQLALKVYLKTLSITMKNKMKQICSTLSKEYQHFEISHISFCKYFYNKRICMFEESKLNYYYLKKEREREEQFNIQLILSKKF